MKETPTKRHAKESLIPYEIINLSMDFLKPSLALLPINRVGLKKILNLTKAHNSTLPYIKFKYFHTNVNDYSNYNLVRVVTCA